jgi:hypothetical protein
MRGFYLAADAPTEGQFFPAAAVPGLHDNLPGGSMVYTNTLLVVGILVSLAILILPAIGMGIYFWRKDFEERESTPAVEEGHDVRNAA